MDGYIPYCAFVVLYIFMNAEAKLFTPSQRSPRIEFIDNKGIYTEASYYALTLNLTSDEHASPLSYSSLRPGQATSTHSCDNVRRVPDSLRRASNIQPNGLSNFYQKYTEAYGIPILASRNVPDDALKRACYITRFVFADNYAVRNSFYKRSGRTAVIGQREGTTNIPEHSFLPAWWNQRARGLGATDYAPVSTGGEENLLCYQNDRYRSEDIYLHEFSHGVHNLGAKYAISGWNQRLISQYANAKRRGLWARTYSMSTVEEYFAEGVQSFFNVNDYSNPPNGIHGTIDTRDKLRTYDPVLYGLIVEVFPCKNTYLKRCGSSRASEAAQKFKINCDSNGGGTVTGGGNGNGGGTGTGGGNGNGGGTGGGNGNGGGTGDCSDSNPSCQSWAARNECSRNPEYMLVNCKKSCNKCSGTGGSLCEDNNRNCRSWASMGECSNNPGYMLQNCKKSCNSC
ncbi:uncharacterized protein LOC134712290 isoform X1 [Mytilus trossulus]|uniref:uncharacterized protein LOC134712290 isoform X1 n=1 Tax=Mytilus trossulus TaxID=6551 RepID=UPI0030046ED4